MSLTTNSLTSSMSSTTLPASAPIVNSTQTTRDTNLDELLDKMELPIRRSDDTTYVPLSKFNTPGPELVAVNPEFAFALTLTHCVAGLQKIRPVIHTILPPRHVRPLPISIKLGIAEMKTLNLIVERCLKDGYPISKIMALNWLEMSEWKILPTLKCVKDFVDRERPKLHEKLWDIYTANTVSWVSAKRLYEDDTQHVTDLCKMGSIDLAIGLIAICGGSASLAVEFYRHAVNMMMTYWMDALKFDIFTSHTLEIEIARFSEVVFKASEHYLLTD